MFLTQGFKAGPGPDNDFWFQPMSQQSLSGAVVTSETGLGYSTIWKCVRAYSDAVGTMPRRLMRETGERKRERMRDHPVAQLLSVRPNRWQTPAMFVGMLEAHAQLRGNGYAQIVLDRESMQPQELVPLHPDRVTPEVMMDGLPRWRVKPPRGQVGAETILLPGEMFHIPTMTMDGYTGLSPLTAQREAIGAAIASRDFGSRFWNNDARPPFWIEVPGKFKDIDGQSDFREKWQASYGGSNRHKPAVLDRGMKIHEIGLSNEDAQWMDARGFADRDLCGIWRVPPHKVGILQDAKYANIEQQAIEWVTDSLLPRMVMWEEVCQRDLLGYEDGLYVKFIPDQLLRGDTKARYEAYGKGITDGHLTRNEARELEDRDALPGLDEPLQPLNMARAGQATLPGRDRTSDRAQAIMQAAAERVARREAALVTRISTGLEDATEAFAKHARFVADVLAVPLETATAYCSHTQARMEQLKASGALAKTSTEDWTDTQFAALLRLGA